MFVLSVYWWLKTGSCWFLHQKCVTTFLKSVKKVCIWILNCHTKNKCKFEAFWSVFKSFCYTVFTYFPKTYWWWGENKKEPEFLTRSKGNNSFVAGNNFCEVNKKMSTAPVNSSIFLSIRKNVLYSNTISNTAIFQKPVWRGFGDKSSGLSRRSESRNFGFLLSRPRSWRLILLVSTDFRPNLAFFLSVRPPNTLLQGSSKCWLGNRENPSNCIIHDCIFKTVYWFCKVVICAFASHGCRNWCDSASLIKWLVPSLANFLKRSICLQYFSCWNVSASLCLTPRLQDTWLLLRITKFRIYKEYEQPDAKRTC